MRFLISTIRRSDAQPITAVTYVACSPLLPPRDGPASLNLWDLKLRDLMISRLASTRGWVEACNHLSSKYQAPPSSINNDDAKKNNKSQNFRIAQDYAAFKILVSLANNDNDMVKRKKKMGTDTGIN